MRTIERIDHPQKDVKRYRFIFTGLLPSADTISSATVEISPTGSGITAPSEALALRSIVGHVVNVYIDAATADIGREFVIKCIAHSSSGVTSSLYLVASILEPLDGTVSSSVPTVPSGIYHALVSQAGTGAPTVASLLANTLGITPVFARTAAGVYTITAANIFVAGKTSVVPTLPVAQVNTEVYCDCVRTDASTLTLTVRDLGGTPVDGFALLDLLITVYT